MRPNAITYIDGLKTRRRYARSINLERDLADTEALAGYIVTPRAHETLQLFCERYYKKGAVRAFTITAVYGAGKSAFMHFLLSLLAPANSLLRDRALSLLKAAEGKGDLYRFFAGLYDAQPAFVRAVAVSRTESIAVTLARAILEGVKDARGATEKAARATAESYLERVQKGRPVSPTILVDAIQSLASARPVIVAIDELGKNLEQAAFGENDVYLLQMLAELPQQQFPVYFFGLLHSAFSNYGGRLGARERAEWQKIQGRFEDIPFLDSTENTLGLIAAAMEQKPLLAKTAARVGEAWQKSLHSESNIWSKVFPLHPLAARALPMLCARFGQNERSLFNYLTGHEPHSFHAFLSHTPFVAEAPRLLRLSDLYEYFIESASLASIERQSRLVELRDRIRANEHLDAIYTEILKTIAVLNALSTGGLKASHEMVMLAMADIPGAGEKETGKALAELVAKRVITYRKQADEYRLWAGSENDVEALIKMELLRVPKNLAEPLNTKFALRTVVASRHSFETGTLRYFPALFVDAGQVGSSIPKGDGYVLYDISEPKTGRRGIESQESLFEAGLTPQPPLHNVERGRKPVIRITSTKTHTLRTLAREVLALESLMHGKQALSLDAVAKREITERYYLMAERLREVIQREFTVLGKGTRVECNPPIAKPTGTLSQIASILCDKVYHSGFKLKNELINRQQLSAQIAKARGEIAAKLLKYREKAKEHFSGNGPEVSIFRTLSEKKYSAGLRPARTAIEKFANNAKEATPLSGLFAQLTEPPYGIRLGVIPLLLVQYLLENEDTVSLYQDGSFVPEITPELLEILVRRPERFALKKFVISGLQEQYFQELLKTYAFAGDTPKGARNRSLLSVIKPLMRFSRQLPRYTQQTRQISEKAQRLRAALTHAKEPDTLLFKDIPEALGISNLAQQQNTQAVRTLTKTLTKCLHELQNAYLQLLENCRSLLREALRIPEGSDLRQYLSTIAGLLAHQVLDPALRRFMNAAQDKNKSEQQWLEGLIMVIADKPAEAWRDEDRSIFEANLAAIAQKFLNLHQLAAKVQAAGNGKFDARLVSITHPDGSEFREVIWTDAAEQKVVQNLIAAIATLPAWRGATQRTQQAVLLEFLQKTITTDTAGADFSDKNKQSYFKIERRGKSG